MARSSAPFSSRDWFDDMDRSHSLFDQFFGDHVFPFDDELLFTRMARPFGGLPPSPLGMLGPAFVGGGYPRQQALVVPSSGYQGPSASRHGHGHGHGGALAGHHGGRHHGHLRPASSVVMPNNLGLQPARVVNDKGDFEVNLDVHHFQPEEITVKTVADFVIVEGKHEEKDDEHGSVRRHFVRKYLLPEGVKPEKVSSMLTSDGVLKITGPRDVPPQGQGPERVVPIEKSPHPAILNKGKNTTNDDDDKTNDETKKQAPKKGSGETMES